MRLGAFCNRDLLDHSLSYLSSLAASSGERLTRLGGLRKSVIDLAVVGVANTLPRSS